MIACLHSRLQLYKGADTRLRALVLALHRCSHCLRACLQAFWADSHQVLHVMPPSKLPQQAPPSPSPSPSDRGRLTSATRAATDKSTFGKMLKIHSLLNPEDSCASTVTDDSPLLTPNLTANASAPAPLTRSATPLEAPPAKKQKLAKDAPVFTQGTPQKPVNYEPFETSEDAVTLTTAQQQELRYQHERFGIWPNGNDGLIRDYVKHIPYQSEKKGFFAQTGRDAFEGECSLR